MARMIHAGHSVPVKLFEWINLKSIKNEHYYVHAGDGKDWQYSTLNAAQGFFPIHQKSCMARIHTNVFPTAWIRYHLDPEFGRKGRQMMKSNTQIGIKHNSVAIQLAVLSCAVIGNLSNVNTLHTSCGTSSRLVSQLGIKTTAAIPATHNNTK